MIGDFSATTLQDIQIRADRMFAGGVLASHTQPEVDALRVLLQRNVGFSFTPLAMQGRGGTHKRGAVKANWIVPNGLTAVADDYDCEINGQEAETASDVYEMSQGLKVEFKLRHEDFATNEIDYQEAYAMQLLMAEKALFESATGRVLAQLYANRGKLTYPDLGTYNALTKETELQGSAFSAANATDTITHLQVAARYNKINNPFMLSGFNFLQQFSKAQLEAGNADGSGAAAATTALPMFWDLHNVDEGAAVTDRISYLVDGGSYGIAYRNYTMGDKTVGTKREMTMRSRLFPDIVLDVFMDTNCENTLGRWVDNVRISLAIDLFNNPVFGTERTGKYVIRNVD